MKKGICREIFRVTTGDDTRYRTFRNSGTVVANQHVNDRSLSLLT